MATGLVGPPPSPAVAQPPAAWQREATEFGWLLDYEQARQVARETGRPLMVVLRCVP